jgi:hypothetical protein
MGPRYIARITSMFENTKTKEQTMGVRWFWRSCELPEGVAGVDFKGDCKEIFMRWGCASEIVVTPVGNLYLQHSYFFASACK